MSGIFGFALNTEVDALLFNREEIEADLDLAAGCGLSDEGVSHRGSRFELLCAGELGAYLRMHYADLKGRSLRRTINERPDLL